MTRARVLARTRKEDRDRLVDKTPKELAENVVGIGEHMVREAGRIADAKDRAEAGKHPAFGASTLDGLRQHEAFLLAHARAELVAICDEMRARIDHLMSGKDIGDGVHVHRRRGREYAAPALVEVPDEGGTGTVMVPADRCCFDHDHGVAKPEEPCG